MVIEPCRFLSQTYETGCGTHDTHSNYGSAIQRFFLSCEESDLHWKDVTFSELLAYRKILLGKYSARSINNYLAAIRGLFTWSVRHGVLSESPFPTKSNRWERSPLKVPESEVAPRAIPAKHLAQIFDKMNETFRLALKLAICTGLRSKEIAELKCSTLPAASSDYAPLSHFSIRRKGGKPAKITVPTGLIDELHRYIDFGERARIVELTSGVAHSKKDRAAVFLGVRGNAVTRTRLSKVFCAAVKAAGHAGKGYTFHGLRHTYALTMLKELLNANERMVKAGKRGFSALLELKKLMGHKHISTTEKYLTALAEDESEITDSIVSLYKEFLPPTDT